MEEITQLLQKWQDGDRQALEDLIPFVYRDLHRLAKRELGRRRGPSTLDATVLVHEAYMRLENGQKVWKNRGHFFAVASKAMRQIVVDHARRSHAEKRGGGVADLSLEEGQIPVDEKAESLLALDQALNNLSKLNERLTQVVECRFFAGLSVDETAEALGVTRRTVHRDWIKAQTLLRRELG